MVHDWQDGPDRVIDVHHPVTGEEMFSQFVDPIQAAQWVEDVRVEAAAMLAWADYVERTM